ncbi:MAG: cyclic nucleotide-binding domain-containing protein [Spirochaetes bacterium]|nr:cyclic nucleotide-binding domain-containing protein [Spirochaetota bacterium]MBU1079843.1 cyclic nucleotide-binding domain-containing protein [Spirochaetota bacterium]
MVDTAELQAYSLFGGLTVEQIGLIRPLMGTACFESGAQIIREGQPNDSIYFILEGRVDVSRCGVVIITLPEGQTFGEMELLDVMPSVATITAVGPVRVVTISNRCIRTVYQRDPKVFGIVMMNLARDLSRRLRRMDEMACDADEKPAGFLRGARDRRPSPSLD